MRNTKCISIVGLFVVAIVISFSSQQCLAGLYSGSLSHDGGGLSAKDGWISYTDTSGQLHDTTLTWEITDQGGYYEYEYIFDGAADLAAQLSHIIFQVSLNFDLTDPMDFANPSHPVDTSEDPKSYDNPMGFDFYGIKFETSDNGDPVTITFNSYRTPMWGDFFAKDGTHAIPGTSTTEVAYAWNTYTDTVAVPDTSYIPVPPAVLLGMLGMCVAGIKLRKYA